MTEKRNAKAKGSQQVAYLLQNEGYLCILEELTKETNPADIARKLGITNNAMSKRIAVLRRHGLIEEKMYSTYKIYQVAYQDSMTIPSPQHSENINIHNIRAYYKIVSRGLNPTTSSKMSKNYRVKTLKFKDYIIQVGKNKIAVIFKEKYAAYINNKFTGQDAKNILTKIADDRINEFCNKFGWKVDFSTRDVTTEAKVIISGLEGVKGVHTPNFKMVYGDGSVEGDINVISDFLEGVKVMATLPQHIEVIEKAVVQLQDVSLKTVEVLGKIEAMLSGKVNQPNTPMKPYKDNDTPDYIY